MKFGMSLQNRGPGATPDNLSLVAKRAEALGFDSAFMGDHVVIPDSFVSDYPYSATGEFTGAASGEWLDQLTALTYVAAVTERIRVGSGVLILPHRNPVVTAKMLSTLDVLSKGRLIVGVGVGWLREEFEALGLPAFEERGAVGNEYLLAFKELWTQETPSFAGKYWQFLRHQIRAEAGAETVPAHLGWRRKRTGIAASGHAGGRLAPHRVKSAVSVGDGFADAPISGKVAAFCRGGRAGSRICWRGLSGAAVSAGRRRG